MSFHLSSHPSHCCILLSLFAPNYHRSELDFLIRHPLLDHLQVSAEHPNRLDQPGVVSLPSRRFLHRDVCSSHMDFLLESTHFVLHAIAGPSHLRAFPCDIIVANPFLHSLRKVGVAHAVQIFDVPGECSGKLIQREDQRLLEAILVHNRQSTRQGHTCCFTSWALKSFDLSLSVAGAADFSGVAGTANSLTVTDTDAPSSATVW